MLEPTGAWQQEIDTNIAPAHMALTRGLCRHVGLAEADDDIHRLAFTISGLGVMLHVGNDLYTQIRPGLVNTPQALDAYLDRLVSYALVLVDAKALRRGATAPAPLIPLNPLHSKLHETHAFTNPQRRITRR